MAEQVMNMPQPELLRQPLEEEELKPKELSGQFGEVGADVEDCINKMRGGVSPYSNLPATCLTSALVTTLARWAYMQTQNPIHSTVN
jgi:hypothetical protein